MTKNPRNPPLHRVEIVAFPQVQLLDVAGGSEVQPRASPFRDQRASPAGDSAVLTGKDEQIAVEAGRGVEYLPGGNTFAGDGHFESLFGHVR